MEEYLIEFKKKKEYEENPKAYAGLGQDELYEVRRDCFEICIEDMDFVHKIKPHKSLL